MTNAELAILSLVAEKPRHGYEIEGIIEERGMRDWTEVGFSSIYYLLNKLEKEALIESKLESSAGRGPARKVYALTEAGRQLQLEGALQALSSPQRASAPFLLGLSCYPSLPPKQVLQALEHYIEQLEGRLAHLRQREEEQRPLPPFIEAMFAYSRALVTAERDWMEKFKQEVEAGNV
jgi:DNA-binding PadR family transcriptional regulator